MDKPHILIVDDEENIRLTLSQALASLPAVIDAAADGQQALDKVEEGKFAAILLDLTCWARSTSCGTKCMRH